MYMGVWVGVKVAYPKSHTLLPRISPTKTTTPTALTTGFRFHPTDEELVIHYLKHKVFGKPFRFNAIISITTIFKFKFLTTTSFSFSPSRSLCAVIPLIKQSGRPSMGVPVMASDSPSERAAMIRESLQKSQTIIDSIISIMGSFNHRLSALETAMRPTQVRPFSFSFFVMFVYRENVDGCEKYESLWDFGFDPFGSLCLFWLPFYFPNRRERKHVGFSSIFVCFSFTLFSWQLNSRSCWMLGFAFFHGFDLSVVTGFDLVLDDTG